MRTFDKEACSSTPSETAWQKQKLYVLAQDKQCKEKSCAADFTVKRALLTSSQRQISTVNNKMLRAKVVAFLHLFPILLCSQKVALSLTWGKSHLSEPILFFPQGRSGQVKAGHFAWDHRKSHRKWPYPICDSEGNRLRINLQWQNREIDRNSLKPWGFNKLNLTCQINQFWRCVISRLFVTLDK